MSNEDKILMEMLDCAGHHKPHHDVDFNRTVCPKCQGLMWTFDNEYLGNSTDVFTCIKCNYQNSRHGLFIESLDMNDPYDLARSLIFTLQSEYDPSANIWHRINYAITKLTVDLDIEESKARNIVLDLARCYSCGQDDNRNNLVITWDYTNIKPFYVCKNDIWMLGGY